MSMHRRTTWDEVFPHDVDDLRFTLPLSRRVENLARHLASLLDCPPADPQTVPNLFRRLLASPTFYAEQQIPDTILKALLLQNAQLWWKTHCNETTLVPKLAMRLLHGHVVGEAKFAALGEEVDVCDALLREHDTGSGAASSAPTDMAGGTVGDLQPLEDQHAIMKLLIALFRHYLWRNEHDSGLLELSPITFLMGPETLYLALLPHVSRHRAGVASLQCEQLLWKVAVDWEGAPSFAQVLRDVLALGRQSATPSNAHEVCSEASREVIDAVSLLSHLTDEGANVTSDCVCLSLKAEMGAATSDPVKLLWWYRCRLLCFQLLKVDKDDTPFFKGMRNIEAVAAEVVESGLPVAVGALADALRVWDAMNFDALVSPWVSVSRLVARAPCFKAVDGVSTLGSRWQYDLLLDTLCHTSRPDGTDDCEAAVVQQVEMIKCHPDLAPLALLKNLLGPRRKSVSRPYVGRPTVSPISYAPDPRVQEIAIRAGFTTAVISIFKTFVPGPEAMEAWARQHYPSALRRHRALLRLNPAWDEKKAEASGTEEALPHADVDLSRPYYDEIMPYRHAEIVLMSVRFLTNVVKVWSFQMVNPVTFLLTPDDGFDLCAALHRLAQINIYPPLTGEILLFFAACLHSNARDLSPAFTERGILRTALALSQCHHLSLLTGETLGEHVAEPEGSEQHEEEEEDDDDSSHVWSSTEDILGESLLRRLFAESGLGDGIILRSPLGRMTNVFDQSGSRAESATTEAHGPTDFTAPRLLGSTSDDSAQHPGGTTRGRPWPTPPVGTLGELYRLSTPLLALPTLLEAFAIHAVTAASVAELKNLPALHTLLSVCIIPRCNVVSREEEEELIRCPTPELVDALRKRIHTGKCHQLLNEYYFREFSGEPRPMPGASRGPPPTAQDGEGGSTTTTVHAPSISEEVEYLQYMWLLPTRSKFMFVARGLMWAVRSVAALKAPIVSVIRRQCQGLLHAISEAARPMYPHQFIVAQGVWRLCLFFLGVSNATQARQLRSQASLAARDTMMFSGVYKMCARDVVKPVLRYVLHSEVPQEIPLLTLVGVNRWIGEPAQRMVFHIIASFVEATTVANMSPARATVLTQLLSLLPVSNPAPPSRSRWYNQSVPQTMHRYFTLCNELRIKEGLSGCEVPQKLPPLHHFATSANWRQELPWESAMPAAAAPPHVEVPVWRVDGFSTPNTPLRVEVMARMFSRYEPLNERSGESALSITNRMHRAGRRMGSGNRSRTVFELRHSFRSEAPASSAAAVSNSTSGVAEVQSPVGCEVEDRKVLRCSTATLRFIADTCAFRNSAHRREVAYDLDSTRVLAVHSATIELLDPLLASLHRIHAHFQHAVNQSEATHSQRALPGSMNRIAELLSALEEMERRVALFQVEWSPPLKEVREHSSNVGRSDDGTSLKLGQCGEMVKAACQIIPKAAKLVTNATVFTASQTQKVRHSMVMLAEGVLMASLSILAPMKSRFDSDNSCFGRALEPLLYLVFMEWVPCYHLDMPPNLVRIAMTAAIAWTKHLGQLIALSSNNCGHTMSLKPCVITQSSEMWVTAASPETVIKEHATRLAHARAWRLKEGILQLILESGPPVAHRAVDGMPLDSVPIMCAQFLAVLQSVQRQVHQLQRSPFCSDEVECMCKCAMGDFDLMRASVEAEDIVQEQQESCIVRLLRSIVQQPMRIALPLHYLVAILAQDQNYALGMELMQKTPLVPAVLDAVRLAVSELSAAHSEGELNVAAREERRCEEVSFYRGALAFFVAMAHCDNRVGDHNHLCQNYHSSPGFCWMGPACIHKHRELSLDTLGTARRSVAYDTTVVEGVRECLEGFGYPSPAGATQRTTPDAVPSFTQLMSSMHPRADLGTSDGAHKAKQPPTVAARTSVGGFIRGNYSIGRAIIEPIMPSTVSVIPSVYVPDVVTFVCEVCHHPKLASMAADVLRQILLAGHPHIISAIRSQIIAVLPSTLSSAHPMSLIRLLALLIEDNAVTEWIVHKQLLDMHTFIRKELLTEHGPVLLKPKDVRSLEKHRRSERRKVDVVRPLVQSEAGADTDSTHSIKVGAKDAEMQPVTEAEDDDGENIDGLIDLGDQYTVDAKHFMAKVAPLSVLLPDAYLNVMRKDCVYVRYGSTVMRASPWEIWVGPWTRPIPNFTEHRRHIAEILVAILMAHQRNGISSNAVPPLLAALVCMPGVAATACETNVSMPIPHAVVRSMLRATTAHTAAGAVDRDDGDVDSLSLASLQAKAVEMGLVPSCLLSVILFFTGPGMHDSISLFLNEVYLLFPERVIRIILEAVHVFLKLSMAKEVNTLLSALSDFLAVVHDNAAICDKLRSLRLEEIVYAILRSNVVIQASAALAVVEAVYRLAPLVPSANGPTGASEGASAGKADASLGRNEAALGIESIPREFQNALDLDVDGLVKPRYPFLRQGTAAVRSPGVEPESYVMLRPYPRSDYPGEILEAFWDSNDSIEQLLRDAGGDCHLHAGLGEVGVGEGEENHDVPSVPRGSSHDASVHSVRVTPTEPPVRRSPVPHLTPSVEIDHAASGGAASPLREMSPVPSIGPWAGSDAPELEVSTEGEPAGPAAAPPDAAATAEPLWLGTIEPLFLAELPASIRQEIVRDSLPLLVTQQLQTFNGRETLLDVRFLELLPPDIQSELIEFERHMAQSSAAANGGVAHAALVGATAGSASGAEGQTNSEELAEILQILLAVDDEVRREILLMCNLETLRGDPQLFSEALALRVAQTATAPSRQSGMRQYQSGSEVELEQSEPESQQQSSEIQVIRTGRSNSSSSSSSRNSSSSSSSSSSSRSSSGGDGRSGGSVGGGHAQSLSHLVENHTQALGNHVRVFQAMLERVESLTQEPLHQYPTWPLGEQGAPEMRKWGIVLPEDLLPLIVQLLWVATPKFQSTTGMERVVSRFCALLRAVVQSRRMALKVLDIILFSVLELSPQRPSSDSNAAGTAGDDGAMTTARRYPTLAWLNDGPIAPAAMVAGNAFSLIHQLTYRDYYFDCCMIELPDGATTPDSLKPITAPPNQEEMDYMNTGILRRIAELALRVFQTSSAQRAAECLIGLLHRHQHARIAPLQSNAEPAGAHAPPTRQTTPRRLHHPRHPHVLRWTNIRSVEGYHGSSFSCDVCLVTPPLTETYCYHCTRCAFDVCFQCSTRHLTGEDEKLRLLRCGYWMVRYPANIDVMWRVLLSPGSTPAFVSSFFALMQPGLLECIRRETASAAAAGELKTASGSSCGSAEDMEIAPAPCDGLPSTTGKWLSDKDVTDSIENTVLVIAAAVTEAIGKTLQTYKTAWPTRDADRATASLHPAAAETTNGGRTQQLLKMDLVARLADLNTAGAFKAPPHELFTLYANTSRWELKQLHAMWNAIRVLLGEYNHLVLLMPDLSGVQAPIDNLLSLLEVYVHYHIVRAARDPAGHGSGGDATSLLRLEGSVSYSTSSADHGVCRSDTELLLSDTDHTPSEVSKAAMLAVQQQNPNSSSRWNRRAANSPPNHATRSSSVHPMVAHLSLERLFIDESIIPTVDVREMSPVGMPVEEADTQPLPTEVVKMLTKNRAVVNMILRLQPHLLQQRFAFLWKEHKLIDLEFKLQAFRERIHLSSMEIRSIKVNRQQCFRDSFVQISSMKDFNTKLSISFYGEEGTDAGGLLREWFQLMAEEMLNNGYALFVHSREGMTFQPNPLSDINPNHLEYFNFCGRIVGLAIVHNVPIDVHFTRAVYRHMVGVEPVFRDLESVDPQLYANLEWLLTNSVEGLGLVFNVTMERFGQMEEVDLVPKGSTIPVTDSNKKEYIRLLSKYYMTAQIEKQLTELLKGFYTVLPRSTIDCFSEQELELVICGIPDINIEDLRSNTEYEGYTSNSSQVRWFWEAVACMNKQDLANLLQYATGASKVPIGGFRNLGGTGGTSQRFTIVRTSASPTSLPLAHTCFNRIDLPEYPSSEILREKLMLAITYGSKGFAFM